MVGGGGRGTRDKKGGGRRRVECMDYNTDFCKRTLRERAGYNQSLIQAFEQTFLATPGLQAHWYAAGIGV